MKVIDPGHIYQLLKLDAEPNSRPDYLYFVKRIHPKVKYPGNTGVPYPGTNIQSVLRAVIDRVIYLRGQADQLGDKQSHDEDTAIINNLCNCLYLLEHRAMRKHGLDANSLTQYDAVNGKMCSICGHVHCPHEINKQV